MKSYERDCDRKTFQSFLFFVAAQGEPKYLEVGTTLTLEPDVSTVPQPINSIRWKYGTGLVVDWDPSSHTYYGSFKGRTTLDPKTLRLVINRLTLADSGQFSLETNLGTVGSHEVKVISKCVCLWGGGAQSIGLSPKEIRFISSHFKYNKFIRIE